MKRGLLTALIAMLASSLVPAVAGARMLFGFNDTWFAFSQESGAAKSAGSRIARVAISWDLVEPDRGRYEWSRIDAAVGALRAQGVRQLFAIAAAPEWAAPPGCTPAPQITCGVAGRHRADYVEFARHLLDRYPGSKLQPWNEPNIDRFGRMSPRQTAALTRAVRRAVPGRVIGPAAAPSDDGSRAYIERLYSKLPRSIPMAIHVYPRTPFAAKSLGTYWRQARRIADGRPIWVTEIGFAESQFGAEGQAVLSVDALRFLNRKGARAVIFHCLRDPTGTGSDWLDSLGALTADGSAKPLYYALRRTIARLFG